MTDIYDMEQNSVADRIRARLNALGKNPSAVALEAGLSRSSVLDILKGKAANPRLDTLQKLTGPLKCTLDYLTGGTENPSDVEHNEAWEFMSRLRPDFSVAYPFVDGFAYLPIQDHHPLVGQGSDNMRLPDWREYLFVMGDQSLAGIGIYRGDLLQVLAPPKDTEIVLHNGDIALVRHILEGPGLEQVSARIVMSTNRSQFALSTRPDTTGLKSARVDRPLMVEFESSEEAHGNHYQAAGGGVVEILGLVASITREFPLTEISRKKY